MSYHSNQETAKTATGKVLLDWAIKKDSDSSRGELVLWD